MGLFDIFSSKKRVIADIDRGINALKMPVGILLFQQFASKYVSQAFAAGLAAAVTNELFGEPPTNAQGAAFLQKNQKLIQSELHDLSGNAALCDIISVAAHLKANAAGNTGTVSETIVLWGVKLSDAGILRPIDHIRMSSSINDFYQRIREFETSLA